MHIGVPIVSITTYLLMLLLIIVYIKSYIIHCTITKSRKGSFLVGNTSSLKVGFDVGKRGVRSKKGGSIEPLETPYIRA